MKRLVWLFVCLFTVVAAAGEQTADTKKAVKDWCEITAPASAKAGETITVTVKVLRCEAGLQLKGDAHYFNADKGYDSFAAWGGQGREVKAGDTLTFQYAVKEKNGCPYLVCIFWLSKDGDFAKAAQKANSETIVIAK